MRLDRNPPRGQPFEHLRDLDLDPVPEQRRWRHAFEG